MKHENRVPFDALIHRPMRPALALALAALSWGWGACSPIAPSLFKGTSLNGSRAPEASLLGSTDKGGNEAPLANTGSGADGDDIWSSTLIGGADIKLVAYTTVFEVDSSEEEPGTCSETSCSLLAAPKMEEGRHLTVSLGAPLLQQLLSKGEAGFIAALDFIPSRVVAHLQLREDEDPFSLEDGEEASDWTEFSLQLEPQVVSDEKGSHWVASLPGSITDEQLAGLRDRLVGVEIEFLAPEAGADEAFVHALEGPKSPSAADSGGALIPVSSALKAALPPVKPTIGSDGTIR